MKKLIKNLKSHFSKKLVKDERGQGMMEYILLLVIVVGLVLMFKNQITGTLSTKVQELTQSISGVNSTP